MQKVLHIDANKCTGCLQCEMACSFENYGIFAPAKSRIKVCDFHHTGKKVPYTCTQCDEAWCLHACPLEAISVDKATGAKVVNDSTCAAASRPVPKPAPPGPSPLLTPTGPLWARWPNGPTSWAINLPLLKENDHVMGWKTSAR